MANIFGIGGVGQIAGAAIDYAAQAEGQARNFRYNEMSANAADKRTRNLYKDLYSPEAQLKMLKEAGLSPGLMYAGQGVGGATPQGAQGNGASGQIPQLGLQSAVTNAANMELMKAETELKKSQKEAQDIDNANDPTIKTYIKEKNEAIADANEREAERINGAYQSMVNAMVNIGYYSENFSISKSHGEGESGSEASGWSLSYTDASGQSHNFQIGVNASAQVGLTNGGSLGVNYGKGESKNESHGKSQSQNNATSWAKNVSDAISKAEGKSGNKTELFHVLERFYQQCEEAQHYGHRNRELARDAYEYRVNKYEENRSKKH